MMADNIKLTLPISIQDVLKLWARQAGSFDKTVPPEIQEKKYVDALMELFHMFAKHHEEMDDSNFIRSFRFFRDTGFAKRLHADTSLAKRASKLETLEPDMIIKEPEPIKQTESVIPKTDSTSEPIQKIMIVGPGPL
jgi:hypothetical protein